MAAASVVTALLVAASGWWVHHSVRSDQLKALTQLGQQQVDSILQATEQDVQLAGDYGPLPYELVGGNGLVISSSTALKPFETSTSFMPAPGLGGPQPLYRRSEAHFPAGDHSPLAGRTLTAIDGTIGASAVALTTPQTNPGNLPAVARYRVYVFLVTDSVDAVLARLDRAFSLLVPLAALLVGIAAGLATRRSLRAVDAISARTAALTISALDERVPDPGTADAVGRLARTINSTLERLARAVALQGQFVADASHELRTPLTALRSGLDVAQAYPDDADWPAVVVSADRAAQRLQDLIDDMLLLARLDASPAAPTDRIDLAALLATTVGEHAAAARIVCVGTTVGPVLVRGSAAQLRRLIVNVVDNAARYSSAGIVVSLVVGPAAGDTSAPTTVEIRDRGPGIEEQDRERVFVRFIRLDGDRARDTGGSGLGLSIARDIARRHGGELTLHDTESPDASGRTGTGLTVRLTLWTDDRHPGPGQA